jgi:hypothetical protein
MNTGRLALAIIAGFVFIFATDFVIHGCWLRPDYVATASLWRTDDEMQRRFFVLLLAQFVCALAFLYIWAKTGWRRRSIADGCAFGFWMGLFQQTTTAILYVVSPMPWRLALKWFAVGIVQAVLLGALAAIVYKPRLLSEAAAERERTR